VSVVREDAIELETFNADALFEDEALARRREEAGEGGEAEGSTPRS